MKRKVRWVLVARTKRDVAVAPVDFFSIGHVLMGQCITLGCLGVVGVFVGFSFVFAELRWYAFLFALGAGILWEPFENLVLWRAGLKFENKRDSLVNSLADVAFVSFGALLVALIPPLWIHGAMIAMEFYAFLLLKREIVRKVLYVNELLGVDLDAYAPLSLRPPKPVAAGAEANRLEEDE